MEMGDFAEGKRCVERQTLLATEIGEPTLRWMARSALSVSRSPPDSSRREMLGQALATAGELGLANVERRAVALMQ
jgi:hypothetical protein